MHSRTFALKVRGILIPLLCVIGGFLLWSAVPNPMTEAAENELPPIFAVGKKVDGVFGLTELQIHILEIKGGWLRGMATSEFMKEAAMVWVPIETVPIWSETAE